MDTSDISTLIVSLVTSFGGAVLVIITATVALGVAYLVFRFGWKTVKNSLNGGISHQRHDGTRLPKGFTRKGDDFFQDGEKLPF